MTYRLLGIAVALVVAAGCASAQKRADRAFEEGEYQAALADYKSVIEEGTDDWKVYYRAAKAAKSVGSFALAEKYYSHALRKGGGSKVAREFASFYLKTSNYTRAVRLLQFLLEVEEEKQPIYNNIGTALMYDGAPLDAETYLLVAQQMEPDDPLPYVNLGVLYERHLRKPQIAVQFYRCYLELAGQGHSQRERIESRVAEIGGRGTSPETTFECGKPYYPGGGGTKRAELQKEMEKLGGDAPAPPAKTDRKKGEPIDLGLEPKRGEARKGEGPTGSFEEMESGDGESAGTESSEGGTADAGTADAAAQADAGKGGSADAAGSAGEGETGDAGDGESADADEGPTIERAGQTPKRPSQPSGGAMTEEQSTADRDAILERARSAYEEENYETVVDEVAKLSLQQLNLEAMRMYGLSLTELGENDEARQWLEWVVERKPDPEAVSTLIEVYERLERTDARKRICEKFRERDDYEEATERCPSSVEMPDREKLKQLQRQRRNQ